MTLFVKLLLILIAYLLGSIPFGYILTKYSTGKNILEFGSGNIGSTNVKRIAGSKISLYTQLLDMLKGFIPVLSFIIVYDFNFNEVVNDNYLFYIAIASVLGHNFSVFLKFKGGKGVNTTLGASVIFALFPVLISVLVYFLIKWKFKFVSLGSIVLGFTLPFSELIMNGLTKTFIYLVVCFLLIIFTHHENIKRLINKSELQA